jgi:hypothetical protein
MSAPQAAISARRPTTLVLRRPVPEGPPHGVAPKRRAQTQRFDLRRYVLTEQVSLASKAEHESGFTNLVGGSSSARQKPHFPERSNRHYSTLLPSLKHEYSTIRHRERNGTRRVDIKQSCWPVLTGDCAHEGSCGGARCPAKSPRKRRRYDASSADAMLGRRRRGKACRTVSSSEWRGRPRDEARARPPAQVKGMPTFQYSAT